VAYQTPLTIKETLEEIARGHYVLPAIQRELVWASEPSRMTRLFDSILRGYPIGTFLFWKVTPEKSKEFRFYEFMLDWHEQKHRHNNAVHLAGPRELTAILDGQQRLTTLNIGLYGSMAPKVPYRRFDAVDAYPAKRLYVDLRHKPSEDDDLEYRFEFLTDDQRTKDDGAHWYRVGEILDVHEQGEPLYEYVLQHELTHTLGFKILSRLWKAVHEDGVVSYFEEKEQSLSKVLDIFVRVNSGGVVLTKSDLLLSIATAQFESRDAREAIHGLVDDLNATQPGFKFSKDLVLKAGLVLTGVSDVGFKVENFTIANMKILDTKWDAVDTALRIGVKLLASFGFSDATLPADSVLIPLADYIYQRGLSESYVTSAVPSVRADRALLRHWTVRTILKPGIWGSALDGLLRGLHQAITESSGGFPITAIEADMTRRGKSLAFEDALLDDLIDTPYKHKRTFSLLSLLYDWVDTRNEFHVDHVFPRSLATRTRLLSLGVAETDLEDVADKLERLPNLQLLAGPENIQKRAQLPAAWARAKFAGQESREAWLAGHDLYGMPEGLADFLPFYEARRSIMRERLAMLLGADERAIADATLSLTPGPALAAADDLPPESVVRRHDLDALATAASQAARPDGQTIADTVGAGDGTDGEDQQDDRELPGRWTPIRIRQLVEWLGASDAAVAVRYIAEHAPAVSLDDVFSHMARHTGLEGFDGRAMGGRMSAVGFARNHIGGEVGPVYETDYGTRKYRMDPRLAAALLEEMDAVDNA
jgi:hypothetical protein